MQQRPQKPPRNTIPMSEKQMVNLKYLEPEEIEPYLDSYVEVHEDKKGGDYYLHIDHCQILPITPHGSHPVLIIFRRVYVHKG